MIELKASFNAVRPLACSDEDFRGDWVFLFDGLGEILAVFPRGGRSYVFFKDMIECLVPAIDQQLYMAASSSVMGEEWRRRFLDENLGLRREVEKFFADFPSIGEMGGE